MVVDPVNLPSDPEQLRGIVERQHAILSALQVERDELARERAAMEAERDAAQAEVDKLQLLIKQLQRGQFGRRSEKLDPDQLQLGLEDLEQATGEAEAARDGEAPGRRQNKSPAKRNRGALPKHLPRIEAVVEPEAKVCPCCGGTLHVIGEDVSEQLDVIPAQFRVIVTRRPRYGCRTCESAVVQAAAPERPIAGGMATESLLAHVLVSKFGDFLPLYRQAQIFARSGIDLDRSTLANWVGHACWWLRPLHQRLLATVTSAAKIFVDDTPVPVLDPGRGRTKQGRLWAYAVDDRPWCGPAPPAVAFVYASDRKAQRPIEHLGDFAGVLQVDAYGGFRTLIEERPEGGVQLAFCWAHLRRRFYDVHQATGSPIAEEALKRIAELYQIEDDIRGRPAEERAARRLERAKPLVDAFHAWLEVQLGRLSQKSKLAEAIRYALRRWAGFILFLEDGRVELDSNPVERAIRPVALARKNSLFAGSDRGAEHWAIAVSLIQTAKLHGLDPFAYLKDVLERMVSGRTKAHDLDQLLPWHWPSRPTS